VILDRHNRYETNDAIRDKIRGMRNQFRELNEKHKGLFENLFRETSDIITGIVNDPEISKLRNDLNKMLIEIFTDKEGKPSPTVVVDSLTRIKDAFFPIIKEKLRYIDLPIVEVETDKYYYRLSNLSFKLSDILPDMFHIETDSDVHIDLENMKRAGKLNLKMNFYPFKTDIENLCFDLKKKKGMKYRDAGMIDVHIRDAGIMFDFTFNLKSDQVDHFELTNVSSNLGEFKIKVREAKHKVWDRFLTTVFNPVIKSKIRKQVNQSLNDSINAEVCDRINEGLVQAQKRKEIHESYRTEPAKQTYQKPTKV